MVNGACVGAPTALFFPNEGDEQIIDTAKRLCATCPIIDQCADHALTHREPYGVWGGLSEKDRRRILRQRRQSRTRGDTP